MIDRRHALIGLTSAAVAWPPAATAQQHVPVIGYLSNYSDDAFGLRVIEAFGQGLADIGFVVGKNVVIEARWAEGHNDRLPAMASDLVRREVKVIATSGTSPTIAAKAATKDIPIVFSMAGDPVALGIVDSLARPSGNLTGTTRLIVELGPKRLQLIREVVPTAASMALLVNPAFPAFAEPDRKVGEALARSLGLDLHVLEASNDHEINAAFETIAKRRSGALVIAPDAFFVNRIRELGALTVRHRVPAIFTYREFVAAGGLMAYAGAFGDSHRIAGQYTGRILKGDKPADLPVQQSTKTELFINLKTAKALGLTIPPGLLVSADEVIE